MTVMAKKNKKAKSTLETSVETEEIGDAIDSTKEPLKQKKKKKQKNEISDISLNDSEAKVDISIPLGTNESDHEVSPSKKKKKKKKSVSETESPSDEIHADETIEEIKPPADKPKKENGSIVRNAKLRIKDDLTYITDFLSYIHIPKHKKIDEESDEENDNNEIPEEVRERLHLNRKPEDRATSREELQERLKNKIEELKGSFKPNDKKKQKKLRRRMAALEKEKENKELKQKLMEIGINAGKKSENIAKDVEAKGGKMTKPGVKTEKGVIFSKFDFQEMEKEKKKNLDPQAALQKIQKSKEKIKLWEEKGRTEKVKNIENNIAWTNAMGKAQGEKVKDDETLLKKSIKKKQQIKGSKKKKWEARVEGEEKRKESSQNKREENISKRKKDKKDKKLKNAVAKGRHVPGF